MLRALPVCVIIEGLSIIVEYHLKARSLLSLILHATSIISSTIIVFRPSIIPKCSVSREL